MPYVVTRSGARVERYENKVFPPVSDLARALCRHPMYAGHTLLPYSVAHHCVAAATLVLGDVWTPQRPPRVTAVVALTALLHESEVVGFGEVPGPMKTSEQRIAETLYREAFLKEIGHPYDQTIWDRVEFYDKLEQTVSSRWLGLPETVHDFVWDLAQTPLKEFALETAKRLWHTYPPGDQLTSDSPLQLRFEELYAELLQKAAA